MNDQNDPKIYGKSSDRQESLGNNAASNEIKKQKKNIIILIIISALIVIIAAILILIFLIKPTSPEQPIEKNPIVVEKKKIETEPGYSFKTNIGQLNKIQVDQNYIETTVRNGKKIKINSTRTDIYHIYVISESDPPENLKYSYTKLYTCAISIVAECNSQENQSCEPQTILDLTHPEIPTEEEKEIYYLMF